MSEPLPVEIVRPKARWPELIGHFIGQILALFLRAWLIMLILGSVLPFAGPSFWQTFVGVWGLRLIFLPSDTAWQFWTRKRA